MGPWANSRPKDPDSSPRPSGRSSPVPLAPSPPPHTPLINPSPQDFSPQVLRSQVLRPQTCGPQPPPPPLEPSPRSPGLQTPSSRPNLLCLPSAPSSFNSLIPIPQALSPQDSKPSGSRAPSYSLRLRHSLVYALFFWLARNLDPRQPCRL